MPDDIRSTIDDLRAAGATLVFPDFADADHALRELLRAAGMVAG